MIRYLPLIALVAAGPAAAQSFQDTVALDKAVAGFTGHAIGEEGGARMAVDRRLKLAACPTVALSWHTDRHDAVVVTCTAPQWRLFVTVKMAPPPPVPSAAPAAAAAKPVVVIKRGDPVTIVAGDGGFSVTRDGIAASDGIAGGRVLIQVEQGKPPIQAIAVEAGKATLPSAE
jgi:flagellar basal body P-ring formation protein FlgA